MMLVEHDVEATAVCPFIEIEVALVQAVADLRVVDLVGQRHPHRLVRVLVDEWVLHLGEYERTHGLLLPMIAQKLLCSRGRLFPSNTLFLTAALRSPACPTAPRYLRAEIRWATRR